MSKKRFSGLRLILMVPVVVLLAGGLIIVTSIMISELPSKEDRRQARLVKQMRQEEK